MAQDMQIIEKPKSVASKSKEDNIEIHVMPKEFFGKDSTQPEPPKATLKQPAPPPPPKTVPAPKPAAPPKPAVPLPPKKSKAGLIVFLVILALAAGGAATYFLLNALEAPEAQIEEPLPDETPNETPQEPAEPEPGIDVDSDGLTDAEELIYMTDYRNPDTDGDTFLDGNEVFHRYDPLGYAPSTLLDTGSVKEFEFMYAEDEGFVIWYPATWQVTQVSNTRILFKAEKTEIIALERFVLSEDELFADWFAEHGLEGSVVSSLIPVNTKEGYEGWIGGDELIIYLLVEDEVYVLEYDLGEEDAIDYLQTLKMMMNSLKKKNDQV